MEKSRHRPTAALVTVCLALAGGAVVNPSLAAAASGSFTNVNPVTIPATGTGPGSATPYPSDVVVSGLSGLVSKVTVTLTNLTHTFPDDIDAMLVGPAGQNLLFMSGAGGGADVSGVTLTFDDAASSGLTAGQITSGTYRPTNLADSFGGDSFNAPAPAPSAATTLATFNDTNPNGTWSLYVMDDFGSDAGTLGSWTLTIETSPTVTVEQADGQSDPTAASPILFDVTFSEPVTGFTSDDVTIGGTAGATTADVSGSGTDYTIEVSGMTSLGTVTASIPAGAAAPVGGGSGNFASTSTDNTVTFNPPPVAVDDAVSANEDTPLNVAAPGVLANDTDADGDDLEAALVSGPAHGILTLAADGGFQYTPAPNFRSQDSFTYTVNDGLTESAPATVTITVIPTSTVDREQYVDGVYQVLLGRPADSAGLAFWTGQLAAGLSRSDFTRLVEASGEGIDTQIRRSYLAILDRAPDAAGLAAWHAFLAGGGTTRMLEAQLAGSPEFLAGAGGTNAAFVAEAYRELLGREADSAGSTFWQNALTAGASRTAVAQALIDSAEGVGFQLTGIYGLALGRAPDAAGATFWATQVRTGDRRFVLAAFTASDEFFALSTAG